MTVDAASERKHVTVLFADVRGSMELAEQLDIEEWRGIIDRFFVLLADGASFRRDRHPVHRRRRDGGLRRAGRVRRSCAARLRRGAPSARRAPPARADAPSRARARFRGPHGLNSGEVVVGAVGDDARREYTALGHAVGLAQRVEQVAAADAVEAALARATSLVAETGARSQAPFVHLVRARLAELSGDGPRRAAELRAAATLFDAIGAAARAMAAAHAAA